MPIQRFVNLEWYVGSLYMDQYSLFLWGRDERLLYNDDSLLLVSSSIHFYSMITIVMIVVEVTII